jgi:hypothetical protein
MASVISLLASGSDTSSALSDLESRLHPAAPEGGLIFSFYGVGHDDQLIADFISRKFPCLPVIGGTSSGGLMTERGFASSDSIGLMILKDAGGDYGVACGRFDDDAATVAKRVLEEALDSCDCTGQLPEVIWTYQTPGHEEDVMRGLREVVKDHCPIIGGTAADNDCSGRWRALGPAGPLTDGIVIAVMFPSSPIGFAFQGGYEPAGPHGTITSIGFREAGESGVVTEGSGRDILTIDGIAAAEVYNRWAQNAIHDKLASGGSILAETTMFPLAMNVGEVDGVAQYLLIHPEAVLPNGGIRTFREVEVGMRVHAMRGHRRQLVARAGRVVEYARMKLPGEAPAIAGAIMVYCGGCKLAIGDDISAVATTVNRSLEDAPFIGCFTFGEQGFLRDCNVHGNLMISALVFGR